MYEFRGINDQTTKKESLPSVAMNYNGLYFEDELDGYRTLNVGGREMLGVELTSEAVKYGSITTGEQYPGRELTISYQLSAPDNTTFQKRFKELQKLLYVTSEVPIYFNDEQDTFFYGRLTSVGEVPPNKNDVFGEFTVHCDSPFKTGERVYTNGSVDIDTYYPTQPDKITLTIDETVNSATITNGTQTIELTGTMNAGDVLEIDVRNGNVSNGDSDITYFVDLNSDFENFTVENGQTVSSPQGSIELELRERWL